MKGIFTTNEERMEVQPFGTQTILGRQASVMGMMEDTVLFLDGVQSHLLPLYGNKNASPRDAM